MRVIRFVLLFTAAVSVRLANAGDRNWIDTTDRAQVADSAGRILNSASTLETRWDARGRGQAYEEVVLERINWARRMAGLSDVETDPVFDAGAQSAASLMAVNGRISHTPTPDWKAYDVVAANAASRSNLCLNFPEWDAGCVIHYLQDDGKFNAAVAHRRWLLFPGLQKVGIGNVQESAANKRSSAIWVIDPQFETAPARPTTRDGFVAWPCRGFFPEQALPNRWSFSLPDADFSHAAVQVFVNGEQVPVDMEAIQLGYGDNTLVWLPKVGAITGGATARVAIRGVAIGGTRRDFSYDVMIFDLNSPTPGGSLARNPAGLTIPAGD